MRKRRRAPLAPSSSHRLAQMVLHIEKPFRNARNIRESLERQRFTVAHFAGTAGAAWAIAQLSASPFVAKGWPNPCKAARMNLRRKAAAR